MKAPIALAVVIALACPLVCAPAAPAAEVVPLWYEDDTLGYRVAVPATWRVAPGMIMAATSPLDGPTDKFQENIKVVAADLQPGVTLEQYVDNSLVAWKAIWKVQENEAVRIGATPAHRLVIDQTLGTQKTRLLKVFLANKGKVYIITCAADPARFKDYELSFWMAITSFEFIPVTFVSAVQRLQLVGGSLIYPPTWRRSLPTAIWQQVGDRRATLMASIVTGTLPLHLEAIRRLYQGGKLGQVVTDAPATLGGQPAHRLVIKSGEGEGGDTRIRLLAEREGRVVEIMLAVDTAGEPPRALLKDFEDIAATWKWE